MVNDEAIKVDFNDRLISKEISDFDEYKRWIFSISGSFRTCIMKEGLKKSLLNNQNDYFRSSVAEMQEPRPMLELMEEYISEHQLLTNEWQEG